MSIGGAQTHQKVKEIIIIDMIRCPLSHELVSKSTGADSSREMSGFPGQKKRQKFMPGDSLPHQKCRTAAEQESSAAVHHS